MSLYNSNDPSANTNQRMPPLQLPAEYPYVRMYQFRDGSWWRQDEYHGNESYSRGHITGSFYEHTALGGHKNLIANCSHLYTTAGSTSTTDLNHHNKLGGSKAAQVGGDQYEEHFNDSLMSIGKNVVKINGGMKFQHTTGKVEHTSTEDWVTDHNDGNHHHNVDGDHVQYTGNNKYDYIGGEKGTYLPNGNYDISLDQGKFQILVKANTANFQAQSNLTIISSTSITLQVGQSSIVITPSKIVLTSAAIQMNNS